MSFPQDEILREAMRVLGEAPSTTTADELTAQLNKLPYASRVRAMSVWANRHRGDAVAAATIKALIDATPSGEPLELSVDEEVSNLFPPQRTAVTAKFHVHQAGVFAAAASNDKETLKAAAVVAKKPPPLTPSPPPFAAPLREAPLVLSGSCTPVGQGRSLTQSKTDEP